MLNPADVQELILHLKLTNQMKLKGVAELMFQIICDQEEKLKQVKGESNGNAERSNGKAK